VRLRISLFGIGYVGLISAACLARDGHAVIAVDIDPEKVSALNQGLSSSAEPGLEALIRAGVKSGRLRGSLSLEVAVAESEISIICVGARSAPDGSLDMSMVERLAADIGHALAQKDDFHAVVVRSTFTPCSMAARIAPALEQASGRRAGLGFGLACYPEFFREGSAISDYDDPNLMIMAATDDETLSRLRGLQPDCPIEPAIVSLEEAEAIKAVSNVWRGVKVSFANEIGGVLGALDIDSHRVMEVMCRDRRLNISAAYLQPGFAFGGPSLPKDIRGFEAFGKALGRNVPMASAVLRINQEVIEHAVALVKSTRRKRVSIIGLAFKPGVDDLGESPSLILAQRLAEVGCDLRLFDEVVSVSTLAGANLTYPDDRLEQLSGLMCDTLEEAIRHGETLVLAHPRPGAAALDLAGADKRIIDLVRVRPGLRTSGNYVGMSW
jgi:GDP-mannose 6-dehydrogenase